MKKVLAMLLALVLVFSMGTVALAASGIEGDTEQNVVVNVTGGEVTHTRCVIIEWNDLTFDYVKGGKTWDPEAEEYVETESWWDGDNTSTVTVTNKSDQAVTVGVSVSDRSADDGFAASVDTTGFVLENYYGRATADSKVINITVEEDGDPVVVTGIVVCTIKLTIS